MTVQEYIDLQLSFAKEEDSRKMYPFFICIRYDGKEYDLYPYCARIPPLQAR